MSREFVTTLSSATRRHATEQPSALAITVDDLSVTYAELDALADRFAQGLTAAGIKAGHVIASLGQSSIENVALMIGSTRIGAVLAPLPVSGSPTAIRSMIDDSGARLCFADRGLMPETAIPIVALAPAELEACLEGNEAAVLEYQAHPQAPATIIYSSGTTGVPKGIVQSFEYRARLLEAGPSRGYSSDAVTLLATPLYSNTTLASFLQTLGSGGHVVLMRKFAAEEWLALAERHRVTHAMLVPVMIDRILNHPRFAHTDLSAFKMKYCTSAPFAADLKRRVLKEWPGGLVEFYGMTEGGPSFVLFAHEHPDKLHTVGRPSPGSEVRIVDEDGKDVDAGEVGEIIGRAPGMMLGYHNRPDATAEIRFTDPDGRMWQRTGDIGRLDEDGFLTIVDRKKDMIISGGFNIFPADLEAVIHEHPDVREATVVGVPDPNWGETPVAFVVAPGCIPEALKTWINDRVGKMQRIADVVMLDTLPRGDIGKVLKRALRDRYVAGAATPVEQGVPSLASRPLITH